MRLLAACFTALASLTLMACHADDPPAQSGGGGSGGACAATPSGGLPLLAADCDPLVPTQCGFPFPSSVWLRDDPATITGKRVSFGETTLPEYSAGGRVDRALWDASDGFSPGQPILTHLPGATVTGLASSIDIERSLDADSPTVLLDAETGERVPHFAELDVSVISEEAAEHTFMIRPAVRLADDRRYLVAIRGVVDDSGAALPPTPVFQALRDDTASCDPSVGLRRELYGDIFSRLEKAGVERKSLQLAWDYRTASRENNTRRLLHMRDEALAEVGKDGPPYVIDKVDENPNPHIRRRILGRMTVPLYLDKPEPGGAFQLGPDGLPQKNGTAEFEFLVHIPNSAVGAGGTPGALLQNGHGLLGYKTEGQDGYLAEIADTKNYVAFSVDFVGMAHEDFMTVSNSLVGDIGGFAKEVDRQHQGMLNSLLAMRLMKGAFSKDPATIIDGKPTIDPDHAYYRGDSQGGIFGTTYMAVTTDVTRGLVSVPGMNYSLLLNRSQDFGVYFILLKSSYRTGRNIQLLLGLVQMLWDRLEPDGYAPYIVENTLPGTPAHELLIHVGIGDYQVTPLGAHLIARSVKAKSVAPAARPIFGIEEATPPFSGSAIMEFDFGLPPAPVGDTPNYGPDADDPHGKVRSLAAAIDQEDAFFRTGVVEATCEGVCDPE